MASFRRAPAPAYLERPYQNGAAPLSPLPTPSHKALANALSNSKQYSPHLLSSFTRFLGSRSSRRGGWRRAFYRFVVCFLLGFMLGMTPFGRVEDVDGSDRLSFEIRPPSVEVRLEDVNSTVSEAKGDEIAVGTVSVGIDTRAEENITARYDIFPRKQVIVVTPTYNRAMQGYYLSRLGQVLRLVRSPVLWIVVEANVASFETAEILRKMGVMYRHLVCKMNMTNIKDRGVHQRNTALEHIELHKLDGIVYFADDDNIYSLELFERLREISRFGTWPVAMLTPSKNKAILEGPVCNGSRVIGWHTNEKSRRLRRFHVDMSGFAFNSTILWDPKRWHRPFANPIRQLVTVKEGFQETTFIEQIVEDESQMEGIPPWCSRILNWHLHLDTRRLAYPEGWLLQKNLELVVPVM